MRTMLLILAAAVGPAAAVAQVPNPAIARTKGSSFIGVMVQEIDTERAKALKLPGEYGVEITRVEQDSPAEKAGLKPSDVILQYNGQRVEGMEQFSRMVRETPAGREVKLDIVSNGTPQTMNVKIGARRAPTVISLNAPGAAPGPLEMRLPDMPHSFMSWRSSALGVEVEALQGQLAEFFGVKEGVLVRSVMKGSAAERGGIKAGDVITRVDDAHVATPADISSRIRALRSHQVPLTIMRDHKEMTVTATIEDEDRGAR